MCGRYTLEITESLQERFAVEGELPEIESRYNIAPGQSLPVVMSNSPNRIELMRWGFIPFWAKEASSGYKLINARAETLGEKPAFKKALEHQRCLIPASGFYEWQKTSQGKQPHLIRLKDTGYFAFAGLYSRWRDPAGTTVLSYTIITTTPNELVAPIHNRMPAILSPADEAAWLDSGLTDPGALAELLHPYPAEAMRAYPISPRVNSPSNEGPELIEQVV